MSKIKAFFDLTHFDIFSRVFIVFGFISGPQVSEGTAAGEFHVEGGVNAIYSEILLARMCS
jgi:hypothetical protein